MMYVKEQADLEKMRKSGRILKDLLDYISEQVREGVTTKELDTKAYDFITKHGATPSFKNYDGFPASLCISIDDEVVHGIPSNRCLEEGMLVKLDGGVYLDGFHTDAARTVIVGKTTEHKRKLAEVCKESFFVGIAKLKSGARIGDYASAVQQYVESHNFSVVRELTGHGIGRNLHEDPMVPNYGIMGRGTRLARNLTLALEPMINLGAMYVDEPDINDGWTIRTSDGLPSAHFENTVIINDDGVEIITY
ncbi:MAG: type I methionyl aminopeptidase [Christensenellaceae bacterium]|jgi:methionyl aminopeptidase|nr:type I methionyl aminopeptidase [Christensenellaceae bacterium]